MISLDRYRLLGRSGLRASPLARDRVVLAPKSTMARDPGNPNSGGSHRLERFVAGPMFQQLILGGATVETRR